MKKKANTSSSWILYSTRRQIADSNLINWKWPQFLHSNSHEEVVYSPPFIFRLAWSLPLTNRIQQKWCCANSEPRPQKALAFTLREPRDQVKTRLTSWRIKDWTERERGLAIPNEVPVRPPVLSTPHWSDAGQKNHQLVHRIVRIKKCSSSLTFGVVILKRVIQEMSHDDMYF